MMVQLKRTEGKKMNVFVYFIYLQSFMHNGCEKKSNFVWLNCKTTSESKHIRNEFMEFAICFHRINIKKYSEYVFP